MASLLSKIGWFNSSTVDPTKDMPAEKTNKHPSTAKSRPSISSVFLAPAERRDTPKRNETQSIEEALVYPTYDPNNPAHVSDHSSALQTKRSSFTLRGRLLNRELPRSPRKSQSESRPTSRPRFYEWTDSIRARANTLPEHNASETSSQGGSPRRFVPFRSRRSTGGNVMERSSPVDIPRHDVPVLPGLDLPNTFLADVTNALTMDVIQTARPPATPNFGPRAGIAPAQSDECLSQSPAKSIISNSTDPALPTPMPGTNLPLEDPFEAMLVASDIHHNSLQSRSSPTPSSVGQHVICHEQIPDPFQEKSEVFDHAFKGESESSSDVEEKMQNGNVASEAPQLFFSGTALADVDSDESDPWLESYDSIGTTKSAPSVGKAVCDSQEDQSCSKDGSLCDERVREHLWSPFDEPLFFERAKKEFARGMLPILMDKLKSQGFTRILWRELALPDQSGPPHATASPLSAEEINELLRRIFESSAHQTVTDSKRNPGDALDATMAAISSSVEVIPGNEAMDRCAWQRCRHLQADTESRASLQPGHPYGSPFTHPTPLSFQDSDASSVMYTYAILGADNPLPPWMRSENVLAQQVRTMRSSTESSSAASTLPTRLPSSDSWTSQQGPFARYEIGNMKSEEIRMGEVNQPTGASENRVARRSSDEATTTSTTSHAPSTEGSFDISGCSGHRREGLRVVNANICGHHLHEKVAHLAGVDAQENGDIEM